MPKHLNTADDFEMVPIGRLVPAPFNPNQGDYGAIEESIKQNGFFGALVVNRSTRHVLAGNHRLAVASQLGYTELPVTWVDVDADSEKRILLADNHTSRLGADNPAALAELLAELAATDKGLAGTAFDADDLDQLLNDLAGMPQSGLLKDADPDEVPENAPTRCKAGDLWQLGRHKVGCLDSLKRDDVCRLMDGEQPGMVWADPPYGIDVVNVETGRGRNSDAPGFKKSGKVGVTGVTPAGTYAPIIGDETTATAEASSALALGIFPDAVHFWWGGNFYASALPNSPHWVIWDKQTDGNQFADAELCWTNQKGSLRQFRHQWMGMLRESERGQKRVHPTQKPVALAEWAFDKYGKQGDLIFDPFLGSGMSIIAAENTGRRVFGLELSPEYCDVIITRWEKATGQTAELIEHGTA